MIERQAHDFGALEQGRQDHLARQVTDNSGAHGGQQELRKDRVGGAGGERLVHEVLDISTPTVHNAASDTLVEPGSDASV
jgi:hypothetical protein